MIYVLIIDWVASIRDEVLDALYVEKQGNESHTIFHDIYLLTLVEA